MALDTPHEPFGATGEGVAALVPSAPIRDSIPAGQRGVTVAQVEAWLDELSNVVDLRLTGRERLKDTARLEALKDAAKGCVHNAVASYTEAARYAERAAPADTSYAQVLWDRYTSQLDRLAALLDSWLTDPDDSTSEDPAGFGPAWSAPCTAFPDGMRF